MKKYKHIKRQTQYNVKLPDVDISKILLILIVLLLGYFFVTNAIIKYMILKKQFKILESQLVQLKKENEKLSSEIYLLKNDRDTIEYYIRKELKYKKPKEKVLIFNTKKE